MGVIVSNISTGNTIITNPNMSSGNAEICTQKLLQSTKIQSEESEQ